MKNHLCRFTLLLICCSAWSSYACESKHDISWIMGNWQQLELNNGETNVAYEKWHKVSESTYEGVGFTLNEKNKTIFNESLRIVVMQDQLFYIAKVTNNALPIAFKATKCTENAIQFENKEHDFPQQLIYTRSGNNLTVEVSDTIAKGFTIVFTLIE